jgi:glycosyltransferase involved in cell wall biosynthesis
MYKNEAVNIIMPVYNEERTVSEIIRRVLAQKIVDRLIIVNDHSKDRSIDKIKSAAKRDKRIVYLSNSRNMGKGFSVIRGIKLVKNGIIIIQDADLEYFPEDYMRMLPKLNDSTIVLGTRMRGRQTGHEYGMAKAANSALTGLFNLLYGKQLTDMNTCYKVFKKDMLKGINLTKNDFLIEPEILIGLAKKNYNIVEVDIRYKGRTYEEGKKIKASDGIKQAFYMVEKRFDDGA